MALAVTGEGIGMVEAVEIAEALGYGESDGRGRGSFNHWECLE